MTAGSLRKYWSRPSRGNSMTGSSPIPRTGLISRLALCCHAVAQTSSNDCASLVSSSPWPGSSRTRSPGMKSNSRYPAGQPAAAQGFSTPSTSTSSTGLVTGISARPGPEAVERHSADSVGYLAAGSLIRPVPLGERIDQPEEQPGSDGGGDVRPDVAVALGLGDQVGDDLVELTATRERPPLDGGIAA